MKIPDVTIYNVSSYLDPRQVKEITIAALYKAFDLHPDDVISYGMITRTADHHVVDGHKVETYDTARPATELDAAVIMVIAALHRIRTYH